MSGYPFRGSTSLCTNDDELSAINLIPYPLSRDELIVLKLGLSFCPSSKMDKYEVIKDLYLFVRKLTYKFIFNPDKKRKREEKELSEKIKKFTMRDFRALKGPNTLVRRKSGA